MMRAAKPIPTMPSTEARGNPSAAFPWTFAIDDPKTLSAMGEKNSEKSPERKAGEMSEESTREGMYTVCPHPWTQSTLSA